jgi:hypothetical protein
VVLAGDWATDFRYPARHVAWPGSVWEHKAGKWLRRCQHHPAGMISVTFHNRLLEPVNMCLIQFRSDLAKGVLIENELF